MERIYIYINYLFNFEMIGNLFVEFDGRYVKGHQLMQVKLQIRL